MGTAGTVGRSGSVFNVQKLPLSAHHDRDDFSWTLLLIRPVRDKTRDFRHGQSLLRRGNGG